MTKLRMLSLTIGVGGAAALMAAAVMVGGASQDPQVTVAIDSDDVGGVVVGDDGPEAGVWVIAETRDLPTRFVRIVVTDDRGRYVVPDLPKATYDVWVRGYGLVDSPRVRTEPGRTLTLHAVKAPSPRAAARYYPAGYWFSLMRIPAHDEFPLAGGARSQADFLHTLKSGTCWACHQLGSKGTRELSPLLGTFPSSEAAWQRRLESGQAASTMIGGLAQLGRDRALRMFADWTDRIAAGAVPPAPPRPRGIERNVVITEWDWADPTAYLHDEVSTDRRHPTVNANGLIYGSLELSHDYLAVLDPVHNSTSRVPLTVRDADTPFASSQTVNMPSVYWGMRAIWDGKTSVHNAMFDELGRVWLTAVIRPRPNPAFCREGSSHPSAQVVPLNGSSRQLALYDPKTGELTHIDTCFSTHHLMFAEDANRTLWTSGGGPVVGWLNTKLFDETHDAARSQGWTPLILDANGNGRRDAWVEPNAPADPTKDRRYNGGFYAVAPAPDGSIWGSVLGLPGAVVRLTPGPDPAHTALAEVYEPPFDNPAAPVQGFSPRGMDVDRNGVVWLPLASGHLASFDRRKCRGPLNGPTATGQHCPEGWTLYAEPLPQLQGVTDPGSAGASYYAWVDQFDTLGLGPNTPISTGNADDGLLALKDGQWVVLRVPYPYGYYTKWMDGRIDDPAAGWKGRGLYSSVSTRAPFHMETGKGTTSKVVRFQLRPNPLAK